MQEDDLYSNFELKGEWFLPNNEGQRIFGILNFNSNTGVRLELSGDFKDVNILKGRKEDFDIIQTIADFCKSCK